MRPPDADDLSHIIQQPDESARQFSTRFLTKKNQIVTDIMLESRQGFGVRTVDYLVLFSKELSPEFPG